MRLYHGTTFAIGHLAMQSGLHPRSKHGAKSLWEHAPSHPDGVYLTDAYPLYFAVNALRDRDTADASYADRTAAVIEVETDLLRTTRHLVPDEDVLEQAGRRQDEWQGLPMELRTEKYRNTLAARRGTPQWLASLRGMGTCAHLGSIPRKAITRVAFVDTKLQRELCWAAMDAMISLLNYQFCAGKYRAITAFLFNDPLPELERGDPFNTREWLTKLPREGITIQLRGG